MDSNLEALPLFPLADVVLLPQVSVPLYIFEPRYRQMTRDALEGANLIGMVAVRPEATSDMAGDPAIFDVGCVGRITNSQARPDGTFQIVLHGENRFRVRREHPREGERLYRSAEVGLLNDPEPTEGDDVSRMNEARSDVLDMLGQMLVRAGATDSPKQRLSEFAGLDPARLVNGLSQSISFEPIERQQLLEADSILTRFEIMGDLLRFRLAEVGPSGAGSRSLPN